MPPFRSHAKINWHLEIVGRRGDGYHDLRTIFQTIELADELEVDRAGSGIELELVDGGKELAADRTNLAWRAAELYRDRFGGDGGVRIRLRKRIPIGAGLGGGSSNAAAVLAALARSDDRDPASAELLAAAAELGADVPFFLVGGLAAGLGRGDVIRALDDSRDPPPVVWLAVPPFAVSTREVFASHRVGAPRAAGRELEGALAGEAVGDPSTLGGWNDLESTCFALHPALDEVYTSLTVRGAKWVRLSGSGGTICALFTDEGVARAAGRDLPDGFRWIGSRCLGRNAWRQSAGW